MSGASAPSLHTKNSSKAGDSSGELYVGWGRAWVLDAIAAAQWRFYRCGWNNWTSGVVKLHFLTLHHFASELYIAGKVHLRCKIHLLSINVKLAELNIFSLLIAVIHNCVPSKLFFDRKITHLTTVTQVTCRRGSRGLRRRLRCSQVAGEAELGEAANLIAVKVR